MNRHLVTVTTLTGSLSRRGAMPLMQAQGWQLAGKPASAAYAYAQAHDFGRESDDIHTSGEGPG